MILRGDDGAAHRWTPQNRVLAMALTIYERELCSGCGQPLSESTDADGPGYSAEDYICRGCAVVHDAGSGNDEPGTRWYVSVSRD